CLLGAVTGSHPDASGTAVPSSPPAAVSTPTREAGPLAAVTPLLLRCVQDTDDVAAASRDAQAALERDGMDADLSAVTEKATAVHDDCVLAKESLDGLDTADDATKSRQHQISVALGWE